MLYDKDIREPLFEFLEAEYGKVRILEEKNMGKSRADILMITEPALFGVEIKSDADTYARLTRQVKDYDKYFDFNYVVVGTSHAMSIEEHVPEYWGIITVEEDEYQKVEEDQDELTGFTNSGRTMVKPLDFYILRRPQANPKMKWELKLRLLWKPELSKLQELNGMPKYKEKSKDFVIGKICERLYESIEPADLRRQISDILFERDYSNVKEMLKEYRKSETQKLLETETDPIKREEILARAAERAKNLPVPKKRRYRRRRKSAKK